MEKLSAAQQQQLKKMSNERLRLKLISAGYEEEMVLGMERGDDDYLRGIVSGRQAQGQSSGV